MDTVLNRPSYLIHTIINRPIKPSYVLDTIIKRPIKPSYVMNLYIAMLYLDLYIKS